MRPPLDVLLREHLLQRARCRPCSHIGIQQRSDGAGVVRSDRESESVMIIISHDPIAIARGGSRTPEQPKFSSAMEQSLNARKKQERIARAARNKEEKKAAKAAKLNADKVAKEVALGVTRVIIVILKCYVPHLLKTCEW